MKKYHDDHISTIIRIKCKISCRTKFSDSLAWLSWSIHMKAPSTPLKSEASHLNGADSLSHVLVPYQMAFPTFFHCWTFQIQNLSSFTNIQSLSWTQFTAKHSSWHSCPCCTNHVSKVPLRWQCFQPIIILGLIDVLPKKIPPIPSQNSITGWFIARDNKTKGNSAT